jgi:2-phosphosulfolactate phosphatase
MKVDVEWGRRGARAAAERGDVVVIVDVLSFSTAVATAVDAGVIVYPLPPDGDGYAAAERLGAELAVGRRSVPERGRYSLSPTSLAAAPAGTRIVLPSPNGSACSSIAADAAAVFTGALINTGAAAEAARRRASDLGRDITVVACGERWVELREHEDRLRPALEDWLGAGAIVDRIGDANRTPGAVAAAATWNGLDRPGALIATCPSGVELVEMGFATDVWFACRVDASGAAPELRDGAFVA